MLNLPTSRTSAAAFVLLALTACGQGPIQNSSRKSVTPSTAPEASHVSEENVSYKDQLEQLQAELEKVRENQAELLYGNSLSSADSLVSPVLPATESSAAAVAVPATGLKGDWKFEGYSCSGKTEVTGLMKFDNSLLVAGGIPVKLDSKGKTAQVQRSFVWHIGEKEMVRRHVLDVKMPDATKGNYSYNKVYSLMTTQGDAMNGTLVMHHGPISKPVLNGIDLEIIASVASALQKHSPGIASGILNNPLLKGAIEMLFKNVDSLSSVAKVAGDVSKVAGDLVPFLSYARTAVEVAQELSQPVETVVYKVDGDTLTLSQSKFDFRESKNVYVKLLSGIVDATIGAGKTEHAMDLSVCGVNSGAAIRTYSRVK